MAPKQAGAIACNSLARNAPILIQHVGMQMVEKLGKLAPQRRGRPVRRLVKLEASQDSPQPAISPWLLSQLCLQRTPRWGEVAGTSLLCCGESDHVIRCNVRNTLISAFAASMGILF